MTRREEGTVLLSTLLVLGLMSAVALALLATLRGSVQRAGQLNDRAQVELYAQGARDFAEAILTSLSNGDGPALNARLVSAEPIVLPFENGSIILSARDGTHCFRLSSLTDTGGNAVDTSRLQFVALMEALGLDRSQASRVAAAAVDWVDADQQLIPGGAEDGTYMSRALPHRTANVPMVSVSELRAVDGMTEALFQRLRPYLCIGATGAPTLFNIDTATPTDAPVLAAILGGGADAETAAEALIRTRPAGGYGGMDALTASPALQDYENAGAQLQSIVFSPQRVVAETLIRFGSTERARLYAFEGVDSGRPVLSYEDWGRESFQPVMTPGASSEVISGTGR